MYIKIFGGPSHLPEMVSDYAFDRMSLTDRRFYTRQDLRTPQLQKNNNQVEEDTDDETDDER